ncbi:MAG: hypothetical protein PHD48_05490 [Alphaproteobacteria bacterium]|nr:hypothetical protein [Alphaproteobacteria bacterium]
MMFSKDIVRALSLCAVLVVVLAGCSGAAKKSDSYTSSSGAVMVLDSDRESCTRSCNADFDRCSSTTAAQEPVGRNGQMTGILGAQADCKAHMKSCLNRCKAR